MRMRNRIDQMSLLLLFYTHACPHAWTEFYRHKTSDNPVHVMGFLLEWKRYIDEIESQSSKDGPFQGKKMDLTVFEKVRDLNIKVVAYLDLDSMTYASILNLNEHSFADEHRTTRTTLSTDACE